MTSQYKLAMTPQLLNDEQYKINRDKMVSHCFIKRAARSHRSGNEALRHKSAMTPQLLNNEQYKINRDKMVSHCFIK
jgi:hypothetical protein